MGDNKPNRWEGTHLYSRATPGRKAKTASTVKEEAIARLQREREKRKLEAEERRRSLSVGSLTTMSGTKAKKPPARGPTSSAIPGPGTRRRSSLSAGDGDLLLDSATGTAPAGDPPGLESTSDADADTSGANHGIDPAQAAFFFAMEERLKKASQKSVEELSGLFRRNIERIDSNTKAIAELKITDKKLLDTLTETEARAIEREKNMEDRITDTLKKKVDDAINAATISTRSAVASAALQANSGAVLSRRERAYNLCRRSLKAWPVAGEDLVDTFKVFLSQRLKLGDHQISTLGPLDVSRRPGQAAETRSEVLVTFDCKEDRDLVKAAGPNLAGQSDAGLMIHVPGHLLDNLHALNGVGYTIKQRNTGVRRAVKFDDDNQDIFMDIKIGDQWRRITPAEARQVAQSLPSTSTRGSRNLSVEDLTALVQGDPVVGLNAVVVPADA